MEVFKDAEEFHIMEFDQSKPCNGKRHWNKESREHYNTTWRPMTPVLSVPFRPPHEHGDRFSFLWLGSQVAANDEGYLMNNRIGVRLCAKGTWGARANPSRFMDMTPFRIDDILDRKNEGETAFGQLKPVLEVIDQELNVGRNVLDFCKQGARRSAALAGCFIMCKTKCSGREAWRYLRDIRKVVEDCVLEDLEAFEQTGLYLEWLNDRRRIGLPCVMSEAQLCLTLKGQIHVQQEQTREGFVWKSRYKDPKAKQPAKTMASKGVKRADKGSRVKRKLNRPRARYGLGPGWPR